jgi:hypothetical protein
MNAFVKGQEVRWTLPGQIRQEGNRACLKGKIQRGKPDDRSWGAADFQGGYCTKSIPECEREVSP